MRTKKEKDEERYFGLQRFESPQEAFKVMQDIWGEINGCDSQNLAILTDDSFPKMILSRAIHMYCNYKAGQVDEAELKRSLGIGRDVNDYLCDFDFFLYSEKSQSFYTCRMSFKDDLVYMWNDRQWEYFNELEKIYDFKSIVQQAKRIVDNFILDNDVKDFDMLSDSIFEDMDLLPII